MMAKAGSGRGQLHHFKGTVAFKWGGGADVFCGCLEAVKDGILKIVSALCLGLCSKLKVLFEFF